MTDLTSWVTTLISEVPWRWVYVVGWLTTFLLTCYPVRGRLLGMDDILRLVLLLVLWIPFVVAVVREVGRSSPGASPTAGPGSDRRPRESA